MALMPYGFVDSKGTGLREIWGLSSTTTEAWLSLAVVAFFTAAARFPRRTFLHPLGGDLSWWPTASDVEACRTPTRSPRSAAVRVDTGRAQGRPDGRGGRGQVLRQAVQQREPRGLS
jgi:hypothetical protein